MIGHKCTGGGASIKNSPINIHIHIHGNSEPLLEKIKRGLYGIVGRRHCSIEEAAKLSPVEFQGEFVRRLEDG